jgi:YihY family inner membrane protein
MDPRDTGLYKTPLRPIRFIWRVLADFRANQGLILSGAVAFYMLLSIIPFFTVLLVALSNVVEEAELMRILESNLQLLVPGLADTLLAHAASFLEHRHAVSWISFGVMLFFSSTAFSVLENTIHLIFHQRVQIKRRHAVVSAIIPYMYIMLLGLGFFLITFFSGTLHLDDPRAITLFPWTHRLGTLGELTLRFTGLVGMALLLTSFYMVMPRARISFRHALIGAVIATVLWEITRHVLSWYFTSLSMVNVIYGSLATVVVALLSLEAAGVILLLGAQVVAEYERASKGGRFEPQELRLPESPSDPEEDL